MNTTIRPFFSFYGSKWRTAKKLYPAPEHDTIVEPFAGSAGYALRYADRRVILCDVDETIIAIWRYLINVTPREILALPDVPLDGCVDDIDVCDEARALIGFWLNRAGVRPKKSPSAWMRQGIRPGSFWGERVRNTIASQLCHIRHWEVHHCSYEDCPRVGTSTWFIDPPYEGAGREYKHGSRSLDFSHLAAWCRERSGQVIVCENEGASWLPFRRVATVKTARTGRRSAEAVCVF